MANQSPKPRKERERKTPLATAASLRKDAALLGRKVLSVATRISRLDKRRILGGGALAITAGMSTAITQIENMAETLLLDIQKNPEAYVPKPRVTK